MEKERTEAEGNSLVDLETARLVLTLEEERYDIETGSWPPALR